MEIDDKLIVYEYLDKDGQPEQYVCSGHIDSMKFREECEDMYSVKPLVIQHRWRRTKRIVKKDTKKKKTRVYLADVACLAEELDAYAVTVGTI